MITDSRGSPVSLASPASLASRASAAQNISAISAKGGGVGGGGVGGSDLGLLEQELHRLAEPLARPASWPAMTRTTNVPARMHFVSGSAPTKSFCRFWVPQKYDCGYGISATASPFCW